MSALHDGGLTGGLAGSVDQLIEGGAHQLGGTAFRNVTGEDHGAGGVVGADDGADDLAPVRTGQAERKQQSGTGQPFSLLTQVALVEIERRFIIELMENIVGGAGDPALQSEGL